MAGCLKTAAVERHVASTTILSLPEAAAAVMSRTLRSRLPSSVHTAPGDDALAGMEKAASQEAVGASTAELLSATPAQWMKCWSEYQEAGDESVISFPSASCSEMTSTSSSSSSASPAALERPRRARFAAEDEDEDDRVTILHFANGTIIVRSDVTASPPFLHTRTGRPAISLTLLSSPDRSKKVAVEDEDEDEEEDEETDEAPAPPAAAEGLLDDEEEDEAPRAANEERLEPETADEEEEEDEEEEGSGLRAAPAAALPPPYAHAGRYAGASTSASSSAVRSRRSQTTSTTAGCTR